MNNEAPINIFFQNLIRGERENGLNFEEIEEKLQNLISENIVQVQQEELDKGLSEIPEEE